MIINSLNILNNKMIHNCQLREKAVEEPKEAKEEAHWFNAVPAAHWFHPTRLKKFRDQLHWLSLPLLESFGREAPTYLDTLKPNITVFRVRFTVAWLRCGLETSGEDLGDAPDIIKQSVS